jgi:hypothetical protein
MKTIGFLFCLGCILFGFSSCQSKPLPQISEADMEKFINENIPVGSSRSDVEAYLKPLNFDSRSLIGVEHYSGRYTASWAENTQPANVHSHVLASLPDAWTERDGIFWYTYWVTMAFYFDKNEKLIGHSVYSYLDS